MDHIVLSPTHTLVAATLTFFLGRWLTDRSAVLRTYRIPEAVTGGLTVAFAVTLLRFLNIEIEFSFGGTAMLIFFAALGLNARFADLLKGGRMLAIVLSVAVFTVVMQNAIGVVVAGALGAPPALGMMAGSVALIGGHGTAAAWGPSFTAISPMATTIGIASATVGLVAGGIAGGPLGRILITRFGLTPALPASPQDTEAQAAELARPVLPADVFAAMLALALAIALGEQVNAASAWLGLKLPAFVTALFAGIAIGNLGPLTVPRIRWPMHGPALALIAEIALALFLTRALMALELWTVAAAASALALVLGLQVIAVLALARFVLFPALGRDYDAAVSAAGFVGLALGATPTAVANMTALTHKFGPSLQALLVVPLVGAFFVDLVNAFVIAGGLAMLAP
jgi:glutamate:Na+ symporter, ESS family